MTNDDKYITRKQCSEMLGFTQRTIDNFLREGKLKAIKVGRRGLRISKASIDALINDNQFSIAPKVKPEPKIKEPEVVRQPPEFKPIELPVEKPIEPSKLFSNASEDDTDMY